MLDSRVQPLAVLFGDAGGKKLFFTFDLSCVESFRRAHQRVVLPGNGLNGPVLNGSTPVDLAFAPGMVLVIFVA